MKKEKVSELEDVLDIFMHEYSFTIDQVLSHTYYQIKYLTRAMLKRSGMNNQRLMNIYRVSQHGKRTQYDRYYKSLEPVFEKEETAGKLILPEGFQHIQK